LRNYDSNSYHIKNNINPLTAERKQSAAHHAIKHIFNI